MNKKTEDKYDYTIRQISKMIASGDLKEIYSKYLSNCPIGFMIEQDLYDYLIKNDEIERLNNIIIELTKYIEKMSYCEIVDNPKKELSRILEKGD